MLFLSFLQDLLEKDGIPDLRRAARFRYASVVPLEVGLRHDDVLKILLLTRIIVIYNNFVK